ncbi:hypothetical protein [Pseudomonas protegens]|uniref:hypothetical protein n=1 Tax=Pseudomonas protegens TaxID=380021 RepID=UPI0009083DD9|nr:hypothetical protein [Pseudomonas protegens]APC23018.1 hypothetical protein BME99_22235 [Pseudomonas protegens]
MITLSYLSPDGVTINKLFCSGILLVQQKNNFFRIELGAQRRQVETLGNALDNKSIITKCRDRRFQTSQQQYRVTADSAAR